MSKAGWMYVYGLCILGGLCIFVFGLAKLDIPTVVVGLLVVSAVVPAA